VTRYSSQQAQTHFHPRYSQFNYSVGSIVTRIFSGKGLDSSYLSMYTMPTTGRRPSASSA